MLHELLITLSGYPGDIFRPFPPEPSLPTTFAITDFPLLHPSERELLNRLAQLGFYVQEFNKFIAACQSHATSLSQQRLSQPLSPVLPGLYIKALASALDRKLQGYRQVIVQTEAAILSGQDNLGGVVPLPVISARFASFQLVFPAVYDLIVTIRNASVTDKPFLGGRLIDLLQQKAASGVPVQQEWMTELLRGCCAVMMRQIVSWVIFGQLQDPFNEFFIRRLQPIPNARGAELGSGLETTLTSSAMPTTGIKWEAEYTVDDDMIPAMIPTDLVHAILFIGKSISTAKQAKPRPVPVPPSLIQQHLDLILPLVPSPSANQSSIDKESITLEVLNIGRLTSAIYHIRRDIADHLWVLVEVGDKVVRTLESFRRYFLLNDGEFGLGLISALEEFKRNRLSRTGQFVSASSANVSIRNHDLGGILAKAAQGTPAQDDPDLRNFDFRLRNSTTETSDRKAARLFDDQMLGIPLRLWYSLSWPLDFFLTAEDLGHYGDVFAFLLAVRKTQVKLQQGWLDIKSISQQMVGRRRGRGARAYHRRARGIDREGESAEDKQEAEIVKRIAAMRSDMIFVIDCLWTYLQMDVIGPTYDGLLQTILTNDSKQSQFPHANSQGLSSPTSRTFDSIHNSHAEAVHEIRRACLLTSTTLSLSLKDILTGAEAFCNVVARRAAGQDGFQLGLGEDKDKGLWQDWTELCQLNQAFRSSM
ncbi:hypothetical protein BGZ99_006188, partial [Dissophora globulifera]